MAIINKRVVVKKATPLENKLKSKMNEDFSSFMDEAEDDDFGAETEDDFSDLSDGTEGDDMDGLDDMGGEEMTDPADDLNQTQLGQLDTEVDDLLQGSIDGLESTDELEEADDELADDEFSGEDFTGEESTDDLDGSLEAGSEATEGAGGLTDLLSIEELEGIIASPDSINALKTSLVDKIKAQDTGAATDDLGSEEDFGGEEADLMTEEVDLVSSLEALDFDEEPASSLEKKPATVTQPKGETGAIQGKQGLEKMKSEEMHKESVKKSKMLVKAAKAIVTLQKMNEANKRALAKSEFERNKLMRVNGIFQAVGDRLDKNARVKIAESFTKCKTPLEAKNLYEKIVKVIKQKAKPSLNESVKKTRTVVRTIKENAAPKVSNSREQDRIDMLMGLSTDKDAYYLG